MADTEPGPRPEGGSGGAGVRRRRWMMGLFLPLLVLAYGMMTRDNERLAEVRARVEPGLKGRLAAAGLSYGAPVLLRIYKESSELELWMQREAGQPWVRWAVWRVAAWSGRLGPKLQEGDRQAPEGVYAVKRSALNPKSSFHLSFNIGYPNAYDAARGRTGSHIMVHGSDVSVGCFAMTDAVIEEIYLLVEAALKAGQSEVPVLCFPFRFTEERLARAESLPREREWLAFWREELGPIDAAFQKNQRPPRGRVGAEAYAVLGVE